MRDWSVPPLLLALLWIFPGVVLLHAADSNPGGTFFQAYSAYNQGESLERENKLDDALQKFRFCVSVLEQMQKRSPDYNPLVVDFRLKKARAAIARVQSLQSPLAGVGAADPPSPLSSPQPPPLFGSAPVPFRGGSLGAGAATADGPTSQGLLGGLRAQVRSLQAQIAQQSKINEELSSRLLQSNAEVLSSHKEVDLWRVKVVELQSQLSQTRQSNDDLQEAVDRLSREKAFDDRRIAGLESDLSDARADLEVADEQADELFTKLERASKFIEAGEKVRVDLLAERKTLAAKAEENTTKLAKAQKERDAVLAERDLLRGKVEDTSAMARENKSLAARLDEAEKRIFESTKDAGARSQVEQGLRGEVESLSKTLAAMRDQLESGQSRIAELEKQLADTSSATALATGALADENALLKSIVTRELQEQARRQQARKLVEEELEKLQVKSDALLDKLGALAAAETTLSAKEKKAANLPAAGFRGDQSDFTVVKPVPESDLPPELVARAEQANELSQRRRFDEARGIYEEIAKKAPRSYLAAVNLGIAQRQIGDYEQAITAFRRALELKSGDPFALTNLGTAEYRAGNLDEAVEVLQKAVSADAESYLAHYLLGVALNDKGDRAGARSEIQKSLAIKPDYVPAVELAGELEKNSAENSASQTQR